MPLIDIEGEVFAECGAWKNYIDLEDSLSLDELMALYETAMKREERMMRMIGSAMGAEFDDDGPPGPTTRDSKDGKAPEKKKVIPGSYDPKKGGYLGDVVHGKDAKSLPIGLGYSTIKKEE